MKNHIGLLLVTSLLTAGACKKKEADKSAGSATGSATATASTGSTTAGTEKPVTGAADVAAAGGPATCSPTAWKDPGGLFCIEAAGFTAKPVETNTDDDPESKIWFKKPGPEGKPEIMFHVEWYPKRTEPSVEAVGWVYNMDAKMKTDAEVIKEDVGKFAGGKGRYYVYGKKDDPKRHTIQSIAEGKKRAYWCEADSYEGPIDPGVLAACKSLIATD